MSGDDYLAAEERARVRAAFQAEPDPAPKNEEEYDRRASYAAALKERLIEKAKAETTAAETEDGMFKITFAWNYRPLELSIEAGAFTGKTAEEVADGLLQAANMLST